MSQILNISFKEAFSIVETCSKINNVCDGAKSKDYEGWNCTHAKFFKPLFTKYKNNLEEMAESLPDFIIIKMFRHLKTYTNTQLKIRDIKYDSLCPGILKTKTKEVI